jgi:hypothetical protein
LQEDHRFRDKGGGEGGGQSAFHRKLLRVTDDRVRQAVGGRAASGRHGATNGGWCARAGTCHHTALKAKHLHRPHSCHRLHPCCQWDQCRGSSVQFDMAARGDRSDTGVVAAEAGGRRWGARSDTGAVAAEAGGRRWQQKLLRVADDRECNRR